MKKITNTEIVSSKKNPEFKGLRITFENNKSFRSTTLVVYRMAAIELVSSIDDGGTYCERSMVNLDEIVSLPYDTAVIVLHALAQETLLSADLHPDSAMLWAWIGWAYTYIKTHARVYNVTLRNSIAVDEYNAIVG